MEIVGCDEYIKQLEGLYDESTEIVKKCLYDGAKVMADAVKGAVNSIPTRSNLEFGTEDKKLSGLTATQKAGLVESFGISKMADRSNQWNVKLGFDGYNNVHTKKYPGGQPNAMIARSIESGTSFLQPCHFMSRAVNATKGATMSKMSETCDREIAKRMNGGL